MSELRSFLVRHGLGGHLELFLRRGLDLDALSRFSDRDLHPLGLSQEERLTLLDAIACSRRDNSSAHGPRFPAPEVHQVSAMFCDIVKSTELFEVVDAQGVADIQQEFYRLVRRGISPYAGHLYQKQGDGVCVLFGYSEPDEYHASGSVHAALDILSGVPSLNAEIRSVLGVEVALRIGVATGDVFVESARAQGEEVTGLPLHLAQRLESQAIPNCLVISDLTRRSVRREFTYEQLLGPRLKGFAEPVRAWRVVGEREGTIRFDAARVMRLPPFVGRDQELAKLEGYWNECRAGAGLTVMLSGEAGVGKSRLLHEFTHRVGRGAARLRLQCSPHHSNSNLYPVANLLRRIVADGGSIDTESRLERVRAALHPRTVDMDTKAALLATLLSVDDGEDEAISSLAPEQRREQLFAAILEQLRLLSDRAPTLLLIEDIHWLDPTSFDLLKQVVRLAEGIRILLLATCRPLRPRESTTRLRTVSQSLTQLRSLPRVSVLETRPLDTDSARTLVCALQLQSFRGSRASHLSAALVDQIVERTGGIPLFIEELLTLFRSEQGSLEGQAEPVLRLKELPETLKASLEARLDRLTAAAKVTAQIMATVGREVSIPLLKAVAPPEARPVENALEELLEVGVILAIGATQRVFMFRHEMLADVAYKSMPRRGRREQLHLGVADVLESAALDGEPVIPEEIARHCTAGGDFSRAVHQWNIAGRRAAERSANVEATHHFEQALDVIAQVGETEENMRRELSLLMELGGVTSAALGFTSRRRMHHYERALTLCDEIGGPLERVNALSAVSAYHYVAGRFEAAHELGIQCLDAAEALGDPVALIEAHRLLGEELLYLADLDESRNHLQQCIALYDTDAHRGMLRNTGDDPAVLAHLYLAMVFWHAGEPQRSMAANTKARELAVGLDHHHTTVQVEFFTALLCALRHDYDAAASQASNAILLCEKRKDCEMWLALSSLVRGWARTMACGEAADITSMRQSMQVLYDLDAGSATTSYEPWLAEAELCVGDLEAANTRIERSIATSTDRYFDSERARIKGTIVHRLGASEADVTQHLNRAVALARQRKMPLLELRASVTLYDYLFAQGTVCDDGDALAERLASLAEDCEARDYTAARTTLARISGAPR